MLNPTLNGILEQNNNIYQIADDRLYSIEDLLYYNRKFIGRYLNSKNSTNNVIELLIGLEWFLSIINRYHIDLEQQLWQHFPFKCPYCLDIPCTCTNHKVKPAKTGRPPSGKPKTFADWQDLFKKIYPNKNLENINSKLLKQLEKFSDAIRLFMKEKRKKYFYEAELESANYFSLFLQTANTLNIELDHELNLLLKNGCYVCRKTPCECNFFS